MFIVMVMQFEMVRIKSRHTANVMAGIQVSKEYVRQQLHDMGVKDLSEEDLESYTRDFSRLIQKHLQEGTPSQTSSGESFNSTATNSGQLEHEPDASKEQSALPAHPYQQCSALYKTFPGDKENRVYPLPITPTSRRVMVSHTSTTDSPAAGQGSTARENWDVGTAGKPAVIKRTRKVLRKVNGESRVFDESYSFEASPSVGSVTSDLSDLSLSSVTSSDDSGSRGGSADSSSTTSAPHRRVQCKSFIRPASCQLYSTRFKKHDPVARYHYWKEIWKNEKFPGEDSRSALRWQIREQMMQQDLPLFVPPRRPVKVNNYTVPTDKKRSSLRWEIRHQMAQ